MTVQLPEPLLRGSTSTRGIEDLMRQRAPQFEHMFKPGQETLGHFYIPPFQRPRVWTDSQAARLIESIHLGISIGSIAVSDSGEARRVRVKGSDQVVERFPDEADLLIDGLQRLSSIKRYIDNELTVFAGTPSEHRFEDLDQRQRRRFMNHNIGFIRLDAVPMDELKRIYDLMNFGGTAHTEDQRASDQSTD